MGKVPPSASSHDPTWKFDYAIYHAESRAQWRTWLETHHESASGVWLCSWRAPEHGPRCPYPEAVEEAIAFGWIDSTMGILDEPRGIQLFTPRKPKSSWTRLNRTRAAEMEAAGLMSDAGRRTIEIAQANGYWTLYDAVEDLLEPPPLADALDAIPEAREAWDGFPASPKKMMLWWVISAARDDTKARRISAIVKAAAKGERAQG